jgi:hypothetical protein
MRHQPQEPDVEIPGGYATRIELYAVLGALFFGLLIGAAGC